LNESEKYHTEWKISYNMKEPLKSVKSEWRIRAAGFETDETAEVIRP